MFFMKKLFFLIPLLLMGSLLCAQESSPVSPAFYGPNAFPVPEIELEWSASDLSFETGPQLASLKGFSLQDDVTLDGYFKLRFPLFSNRVALTIWGGPDLCRFLRFPLLADGCACAK